MAEVSGTLADRAEGEIASVVEVKEPGPKIVLGSLTFLEVLISDRDWLPTIAW